MLAAAAQPKHTDCIEVVEQGGRHQVLHGKVGQSRASVADLGRTGQAKSKTPDPKHASNLQNLKFAVDTVVPDHHRRCVVHAA